MFSGRSGRVGRCLFGSEHSLGHRRPKGIFVSPPFLTPRFSFVWQGLGDPKDAPRLPEDEPARKERGKQVVEEQQRAKRERKKKKDAKIRKKQSREARERKGEVVSSTTTSSGSGSDGVLNDPFFADDLPLVQDTAVSGKAVAPSPPTPAPSAARPASTGTSTAPGPVLALQSTTQAAASQAGPSSSGQKRAAERSPSEATTKRVKVLGSPAVRPRPRATR
jgi:hypothetical protein